MSAIFPTAGVAFGMAVNGANVATTGGTPLFYATNQCNPRFDPAQANAVISEIANVSVKAGIPYNCESLANLSAAVCALIDAQVSAAACGAPVASADELAAICAAPDAHFVNTCTADGKIVRIPLSKLMDAEVDQMMCPNGPAIGTDYHDSHDVSSSIPLVEGTEYVSPGGFPASVGPVPPGTWRVVWQNTANGGGGEGVTLQEFILLKVAC